MTTFALFDSSALVAASYDRANRILRLRFIKGDVYDYQDVPEKVFSGLLVAHSTGQFFNTRIKPHFTARFRERIDS
jgi:hypothetical protein